MTTHYGVDVIIQSYIDIYCIQRFPYKKSWSVKRCSTVKEKATQLFPDDIEKYIDYKSPPIEKFYEIYGLK